MQGVVVAGIATGADTRPLSRCPESCPTPSVACRPPTLEIFPSWPVSRFQPFPKEDSEAAESTESGSGQNTAASQSQTDSPSPASRHASWEQPGEPQQRQQQDRMAMGSSAQSYPPAAQEKEMAVGSTSVKSGKILDAKAIRRLAQNREAARKSRLRKKAYIQQLESSKTKLAQLEHNLQTARSQGLFLGGTAGGNISSGAAIFDMAYARWLDENQRHMAELRGGLQGQLPDGDLRVLVDECLTHYDEIFQLKAAMARSDVFHLITGMWATPAERCFLWMGGFRPSELLKILIPQLDPLTEQQVLGICSLQQSSQQAEEALSQGLEQLHQSLADTVASGSLCEGADAGNYMGHLAIALGKLANLEGFIRQADNLRQQTLHQMHRILTVRQAARCYLAIGEYRSRLCSLSSLWASRPRETSVAEEGNYSDLHVINHPAQNQFSAF